MRRPEALGIIDHRHKHRRDKQTNARRRHQKLRHWLDLRELLDLRFDHRDLWFESREDRKNGSAEICDKSVEAGFHERPSERELLSQLAA